MTLNKIEELINEKLAGEMLTYREMRPFLDHVIDDINTTLNSKFPVFSELGEYDNEYSFFPDRYLRSIVVPGAAWYYYVMDEEGGAAAMQYQADFQRGLFFMLRDYLQQVPEEYQQDSLQGSITFPCEERTGTAGLIVGTGEGVF